MAKQSAGLLMFRTADRGPEVLLVHPGSPLWAKKDEGAWTIPKGEPAEGEELLHAAQREFSEETGFDAHGPFHDLGTITQAGGKKVSAWAFEGDCDPAALKRATYVRSNGHPARNGSLKFQRSIAGRASRYLKRKGAF